MDDVNEIIEVEPKYLLDPETAVEFVEFIFRRAGEIADDRNLEPPVSVRATDSSDQCIFSVTLDPKPRDVEFGGPKSHPDFPWFIVLVDRRGSTVKVRAQQKGLTLN